MVLSPIAYYPATFTLTWACRSIRRPLNRQKEQRLYDHSSVLLVLFQRERRTTQTISIVTTVVDNIYDASRSEDYRSHCGSVKLTQTQIKKHGQTKVNFVFLLA